MAQYILTRKNISRAIRIYHRVKDDIKITNGDISLLKNRSDRKIKVYKNIGTMLYRLLGGIGSLALAIFPIANSFVGVFIFIALLAMEFFILIKSMKPELTKIFCELEPIEKTVITESNKSSKAA